MRRMVTEEVRMLATMRKFPDQIPNHTIKIDTGRISSTNVEEMNTLPLMSTIFDMASSSKLLTVI